MRIVFSRRELSFLFVIMFAFILSACGGGGSGSDLPANGLLANAGPDQSVDTGYVVTLDGSSSIGPAGATLIYFWAFDSKPAGSSTHIYGANSANPTFTADREGVYTVILVVSDGIEMSQPDTVVITAVTQPTPPVANAGPDQNVVAGPSRIVTLDGTGSTDLNGDTLTYAWTMVSTPEGSAAALSGAGTAAPTFTADVEGTYTISLMVNDGTFNATAPDEIIVNAYRYISPLDFIVLDAEYSSALERIIMVSSDPSNQLHIYDPVNEVDTTVDLGGTPKSVSVSPDGLYAAVGHIGSLSYVDLSTPSLVKSIPVSTSIAVYDVVLDGNGYIHVMTDDYDFVYSVNIATETVTKNTGAYATYKRTGKLHPTRSELYVGLWGVTPVDMAKYDLSNGVADLLYDSPYHGDYDMWGRLWISKDGTRIYNNAGTIFKSSADQAVDLTYYGVLADTPTGIKSMDHSLTTGKVAVAPYGSAEFNIEDTELQTYDFATNTYESSVTLPHFVISGEAHLGHGEYVFFNSDTTKTFVILQADWSAQQTYDYGVVVY